MQHEIPVVIQESPASRKQAVRMLLLEVALIAFALFTAYSLGVIQTRKEGIAQILAETRAQLDAAREAHARAALREAEAEALRKRMRAPMPMQTQPGEIHAAQVSSL